MIDDVSSDISDDDNQDCTDCTVLSKFNKHEAFQKIDELRETLKGNADMNVFHDQLSIFERNFRNRLLDLNRGAKKSEPSLFAFFSKKK